MPTNKRMRASRAIFVELLLTSVSPLTCGRPLAVDYHSWVLLRIISMLSINLVLYY
jgi:hypothetical protein